jgi:hypothetical protein
MYGKPGDCSKRLYKKLSFCRKRVGSW